MKLFIRSQDRARLIEAQNLQYCFNWSDGIEHSVVCNEISRNFEIGVYDSKERCLEILDDIQIKLQMASSLPEVVIYEMPEE